MISTPKGPPPPPTSPPGTARRQREHPRFPLRLSAEVLYANDQFTACTHDCSLGGTRLELDRPLGEGSVIGLTLFLVIDDIEDESAEPIRIRGEVIWCAEGGPGKDTPAAAPEGAKSPAGPTSSRYQAGIRFLEPPTAVHTWLSDLLATSNT